MHRRSAVYVFVLPGDTKLGYSVAANQVVTQLYVTHEKNSILIMRKLTSSNSQNQLQMTANCPITSSLILINGRWKMIILWQIRGGAIRFGELRRAIPLITEKMLTDQLRELEHDGFLERVVFAQVPPRVEYSLTPLGTSFMPILEQLFAWGEEHQAIERVKQKYRPTSAD